MDRALILGRDTLDRTHSNDEAVSHYKRTASGYNPFFRLGDFYEMFFNDAEVASKALEITLTARDSGSGQKTPMCGVPYHAAESYIARLIDKGFRVAICEQVEDPGPLKGLLNGKSPVLLLPVRLPKAVCWMKPGIIS